MTLWLRRCGWPTCARTGRTGFALVALFALGLQPAPLLAHEVRPGYLQIDEVGPGGYDVLWKVPARGDLRLALYARLPAECSGATDAGAFVGGAFITRWRAHCPGGLVGRRIAVDGLAATRTDVLVRVSQLSGTTQTVRLTPDAPYFDVAASPTRGQVARSYLMLGIEHILLGIDHLLFVLGLLLLVGSLRRLVVTVTAFTIAHSITLAAATLGLVHVPQAPVEAVIALSVMFVAAEILRAGRGRPSLTARAPWVVAFAFGLLHGLGFAGALREVGLPQTDIPLALLFFNVGVEVGQLAFIAAVVTVLAVIARLTSRGHASLPSNRQRGHSRLHIGEIENIPIARVPLAYLIGCTAAYWTIDRTVGFF